MKSSSIILRDIGIYDLNIDYLGHICNPNQITKLKTMNHVINPPTNLLRILALPEPVSEALRAKLGGSSLSDERSLLCNGSIPLCLIIQSSCPLHQQD